MSGPFVIGALTLVAIVTALLLGLATTSGRGFLPGLWFGLVSGGGFALLLSLFGILPRAVLL